VTGLALLTPKGALHGSALEAEIELRVAQLRKGGHRGGLVEVVGNLDEDTVLQILAWVRLGARVLLVHPRWTAAERTENAARVKSAMSAQKRGTMRGEFILFTSGTEGRPKAVELSLAGFEAHANATAKRLPTTKSDRWLLALTPAHVGGLALILRAALQKTTLVLPPTPVPKDLTPLVEKHKVTHVSLVPTQLQTWMENARKPPASLRCVLLGGAPCPPLLERRAREAGWPIRLTYGLTEASSQVATQAVDSPAGSVGPPLPGFEVRIDGPSGAAGAILVKTPSLLLRYAGDDAATKAALHEGWFRTPDVGRLDEKGNLWVVGRGDDMIVTGGENVDPHEVEQALQTIAGVKEAAVVGVPDPKWGQIVVAAIVPQGKPVSSDQLSAALGPMVAPFKVPRRFVVVEELPRGAGGKVQRAALRARFSATVPT
jgi:o-succinylbenzoate---CoA ligase